MAIIQGMTTSFKKELMEGVHNFTSHTFKIALYGSSATLSEATTAYSATGEISGTGYTAGGNTLSVTGAAVSTSGATAFVDFADSVWGSATITARGAVIYNSSVAGNPSVAVLDFGADRTVTAGTFTVVFPAADAANAIVRIA